jgi:hypothetical protein
MTQRAIALVSIACAVIVPISLFVLFALPGQRAYDQLPFHDLLWVAGIEFFIFTIPGLILGLPAVLVLRKFAWLRWSHFWDSATVVSQYGVPTRDGWLFLIVRSSLTGAGCALIVMCGWIPWTVLRRSHNRLEQRAAAPGRCLPLRGPWREAATGQE